ncbi:YjgB family protein [Paenibacillus sp. YN15]|uniref:YjgB family protein n=1 Tax=Paenibacillus sp. YN15 TaxID=1742774 RepID=UPI00215CDD0D|nr:YjgB family protein [Paenibacillus sp. YN15]
MSVEGTIAALLLSAGIALLAGCNDGSAASPSIAPAGAAAPAASVSPPAASAPSAASPGSTAAATSPPAAAAPSGTPAADKRQLLHELLELAKQGKAPGVEFAAHTGLIEDVEKAWGEPDKKESAGAGIYSTYSKKNAVFGFNKGSLIFDVRSSAPNLQELRLSDIEAALGKSQDIRKNGDDIIYVYPAGKDFELKFIIPASTGKVSHISVFSPQDSKNNMAG